MEKILRIEEGEFGVTLDNKLHYTCDGYLVITDKQTIKVGVDNDKCCCETWGYLTTNDDIKEFEGAELLNISITDTSLNSKIIKDLGLYEEDDAMFVNFETSNGLLQLVVYNNHNGYYGHSAVVVSEQLKYETVL